MPYISPKVTADWKYKPKKIVDLPDINPALGEASERAGFFESMGWHKDLSKDEKAAIRKAWRDEKIMLVKREEGIPFKYTPPPPRQPPQTLFFRKEKFYRDMGWTVDTTDEENTIIDGAWSVEKARLEQMQAEGLIP